MKSSILQVPSGSNRVGAAMLGAALVFAVLQATAASPTFFWDTNGGDDGAGYPLDGDWTVASTNWTSDAAGSSPTFAYAVRANIIFAATGDDNGYSTYDWAYAVMVHGIAQVSDIVFKDGNCILNTLPGYYMDKDTPLITVLNAWETATLNYPIASMAGTSNGLTKVAFGALVLGATNTYRGPTTIEGGTLRLGAPQVLPQTSTLVLAGGDTRTSGDYSSGYTTTDPTFDTGGYSQTLGPLLLTGPNASLVHTIDFNSGASALGFADSHTQDWDGITLNLVNYKPGVDSLRFGTSNAGLSATQLGLIQFQFINSQEAPVTVPAKINSSGFVTPAVPVILSVAMLGSTNTVVAWSAITGRRYLLHYKTSPQDALWQEVPATVTANSVTAAYTNNVGSNRQRFYRVELLPLQPPS